MLFLTVRPVNFFHEFFSKLCHFPWIDFIILSKKFILQLGSNTNGQQKQNRPEKYQFGLHAVKVG